MDNYYPNVIVLIIGNDENKCKEKERNVRESDCPRIVEVITVKDQREAVKLLRKKLGGVMIITDQDSVFQKDTISKVVKPLSELYVGCVCGMVRKKPNENGKFSDGANWKYENKIKRLESNIGCLSGANTSIFAFNRSYTPDEFDDRINIDFYIPTAITEWGFDVLFEPDAIAFEPADRTETELFKKHVDDGASGFRSILRFKRLLMPYRKGSIVFWSHRVMKWLVPFNMLTILIGCTILAGQHIWALAFLVLQIFFYIYAVVYYILFSKQGKDLPGVIGKLSGLASYFVMLNLAWFLGFFKAFTR